MSSRNKKLFPQSRKSQDMFYKRSTIHHSIGTITKSKPLPLLIPTVQPPTRRLRITINTVIFVTKTLCVSFKYIQEPVESYRKTHYFPDNIHRYPSRCYTFVKTNSQDLTLLIQERPFYYPQRRFIVYNQIKMVR